MFFESNIPLNNSNSKWLKTGVSPKLKFEHDCYIGGDKSPTINLGMMGFVSIMAQIREIPYFRAIHTDVSIAIYIFLEYNIQRVTK